METRRYALSLSDSHALGRSFAAEGRSVGQLQEYLVGCGFTANGLTFWRARRAFDAQRARQ